MLSHEMPCLTALAAGLVLGLSSGLAPGPLMALVISQTLRHGAREGSKVALAPLLTDAPIITIAVALASRASAIRPALAVLSFAGGVFVLYLAIVTVRPPQPGSHSGPSAPGSWSKGALTNLLSPHPWLFWMTIGATILANAMMAGWGAAAVFLLLFYAMLIGAKLTLVWGVARSRAFLSGRSYRLILRTLAVLLAAFGMVLVRDGWRLLGVRP